MYSTANNSSRPNEDHNPELLEMDALTRTHGRSPSHGARRLPRRKSPVITNPGLDKRDYAIGILFLLTVVFLWTSSSFITQDLFEEGYEKPFFVTYMNTSAFSFYLIPFFIKRVWATSRGTGVADQTLGGQIAAYQQLPQGDGIDHSSEVPHPDFVAVDEQLDSLAPLTTKETANLALIFCFFWFIANWSVNAALDFTSVASATVLSSMSGFFTLGLGRIFRVETLTLIKIGGVFTSFLGVALVSWSDSQIAKQPVEHASQPQLSQITPNHPSRPLLGDILALISALFYALYVILLKVKIKSESRVDMQLFFGFVGLFTVLACWPIGLILHLTGAEIFEMPGSKKVLTAVLINMAITLSSDYLYVIAMLKTTPLVVTVGLSLTIPFAVIGDLLRGRSSQAQVIIGSVLVLLSFVAIGIEHEKVEENEASLAVANTPDVEPW